MLFLLHFTGFFKPFLFFHSIFRYVASFYGKGAFGDINCKQAARTGETLDHHPVLRSKRLTKINKNLDKLHVWINSIIEIEKYTLKIEK